MVNILRTLSVRTLDQAYNFQTSDEFHQFIDREFLSWDWIKDLAAPYATGEYFLRLITNPLEKAVQEFNSDSSTTRHYIMNSYISSDGELGRVALEIKKAHGAIVGFMFLLVCHPELADNLKSYPSLDIFFRNEDFHYERSLALHLYFESINASKITTRRRNEAREDEITKFRRAHEEAINNASSKLETALLAMESARTEQVEQTRTALLKNKRRAQLYRALLNKTAKSGHESVKQSQNSLQIAREDLITAQNTYYAQIDLKASVQYWNDEMIRHSKTAVIWLCAVVFTTALTFSAPVFYYHMGGITSISRLNSAKTVGNDDAKVAKTQATNDSTPPAVKVDTTVNQKDTQNPEFSPIVSHIADLTGAALLIALLSIFIRLSLRQFNTHSYLKHESAERLVMTKTYLALSHEGKMHADSDRKLVLEALFRATQSNGVPETSVSTPIELVIKAVTESKPSRD
ncbi:hypothetical protein [Pseudomonas syringae]|uniref:hypothetical protein n=1 Tax=Pseudomonas syringae TaxID=317 RepID=UPI003F85496E